MRGCSVIRILTVLCLGAMMIPLPLRAEAPAQGKDQLVDALDAAFIRVLDSGRWREITKSLGPLAVNIGDCYPNPEAALFPENPVGLLADILSSGQIRVGTYAATFSGSFEAYLEANEQLMRAILDELGSAYGLAEPIEIVPVNINPPSSDSLFEALNDGSVDISDLNSALGGTSLDQRRRKIARYTCTIFGSGWFLHVRDSATYQSIDDVRADAGAQLCSGMLSSRLSKAYFKDQEITSVIVNDEEQCSQGVVDGTYDAYLHFNPTPTKTGLRSIDTGIVSGVPLWVAGGPDNATTTTTVADTDCPLSAALGTADVGLLRELRDRRFTTGEAAELVRRYYIHAPEAARIMADHTELRAELREVAVSCRSLAEELLSQGHAQAGPQAVARITRYLQQLKTHGSPPLKAAVDELIAGLQGGQVLAALGISQGR